MSAAASQLAGAWWAWIVPLSLQLAALGALLLLLDALLLRRAWPALRMVLWSALLVKLVLPPGLASPVALVHAVPAAPAALLAAPAALIAPAPMPVRALLAVWLTGVGLGLLLAVRRARALRNMLRGGVAPPERVAAVLRRAAAVLGVRRPPPLLLADLPGGALVAFVLRPVIVLPVADAGRPARELFHMLLHELSHVRRRDPLLTALAGLARVAFWFHPAVRLASRRVALLRELCCDAAVADRLRAATPRYRATLLLEAGRRFAPAAALGFRGSPAPTLQRLAALSRPSWRFARLRRTCSGALAALALGCVLPMGVAALPGLARRGAVDQALAIFAEASAGGRPGCLRVRNASLVLLARQSGAPFPSAPSRSEP